MKKTIIFLILAGILLTIPFFAFGQYYSGYSSPVYYDNGYNNYNYGYDNYNYDYNNYGYDSGYNNYNYDYNNYNYGYNSYDYGYNNGYNSAYPTYDYSNYNSYNYSPYSYDNYSYNQPYNNNYSYNNYSYPYYNDYSYNNGYSGYNYSNCYGNNYGYYSSNCYNNGNYQNQCQANSYKACSGNKLYWYNSCGSIGSLASDCGTSSTTGNKRCSGNWVQEEKLEKGCGGNSCYSNTVWNNVENCASNGRTCSNGSCTNTSNLTVSCSIYPSSVNVGQEAVFSANVYGGSGNYSYSWSGECNGSSRECRKTFQSSGSKTATVNVTSNGYTTSAVCSLNVNERSGWYTNSYLSCFDNDLYWYDRYNNRISKYQDCQSGLSCSYQYPYCSGNNVYRQKTCQDGQCVGNTCRTTSTTQNEFVESCGYNQTCSSGHCYSYPIVY